MTDEQRFDHTSFMNHPVLSTPNMDRIFREGIHCRQAFCNSSLCVPSRINCLTGQYNNRHGGHDFEEEHHIGFDQHSFVEPLKEAGYRIGLAGKNHTYQKDYYEYYFDCWEEYNHHGKIRGTHVTEEDIRVREYLQEDPRPEFHGSFGGRNNVIQEGLVEGPMPFPEESCPSWRVGEDVCRFLDETKEDPFYMQVSFPDPHWPNVTPEPYYSLVDPEELPDLEAWPLDMGEHPFRLFVQSQVNGYADYTESERKRILATYYGQIMAIDKAIGLILDRLAANGQLEDTVIVFSADHGNFGGRYGLIGKCGHFSDALLRIPLAIRIPGLPAGKTEAMVNMIDLFPTLLDAIGLPPLPSAQGRSFLPVLREERPEHRSTTFSEVGYPCPTVPIPPRDQYGSYRQQRIAEDGPSWFLDHTVVGHAVCVRETEWKYTYIPGDQEELYYLPSDPFEEHNLARSPEHRSTRDRLHTKLLDWLLNDSVADNPRL